MVQEGFKSSLNLKVPLTGSPAASVSVTSRFSDEIKAGSKGDILTQTKGLLYALSCSTKQTRLSEGSVLSWDLKSNYC